MSATRPRRRLEDRGLTLVELLVAMFLVAVVGTLLATTVAKANRSLIAVGDESDGLRDAKNVLDRMSRDVREARGLTCDGGDSDPSVSSPDPTCQAHLQLWIDYNSNYVQDAGEVVTWRVRSIPGTSRYSVERTLNGVTQTQSTSLISAVALSYSVSNNAAASNAVTVDMTYDANSGVGTGTRHALITLRLRNAA